MNSHQDGGVNPLGRKSQDNSEMQGGAKKRLSNKTHCAPGNKGEAGSCLNKDLIQTVAGIMNSLSRDTARAKTVKQSKKGKSKKGKRKKGKKGKKGEMGDMSRYALIDLSLPCHMIHGKICENLEKVDGCNAEACMLFKEEKILKRLSPQDREDFEFSFQPAMDEDMLETKVETKKVKKNGRTIYKPYAKEDNDAWLSTDNILGACLRDMEVYPEYEFLGVEPVDFGDCSVSQLCSFNPETYRKKGKTKLGFVFNTDPHDEDGEHWISLYMDLGGHNLPGNPAVYYFDSYGRDAPEEVEDFVKKCQGHSEKEQKKLHYLYNDKDFQKSGSQCGMYAIHFLREMAKGTPFEDYMDSNPTSSQMKKLRPIYFVSPKDI